MSSALKVWEVTTYKSLTFNDFNFLQIIQKRTARPKFVLSTFNVTVVKMNCCLRPEIAKKYAEADFIW